MRAEKVILSFVAIIVGLIAAGIAFYFYQMTKALPSDKNKPMSVAQQNITPSPTPDKSNILTVESPKEEEVVAKKTIIVNGKTDSKATIVVSTEDSDQVVKPAANGDFSVTQAIPTGTTLLLIKAIFANGEEKTVTRTVTFSTENF